MNQDPVMTDTPRPSEWATKEQAPLIPKNANRKERRALRHNPNREPQLTRCGPPKK